MIPFDVPGWAIGDALDLARQLPDDSIDCIVTSPPYWGLRSYLPDDHPDKGKEMGAEPTLAEYVAGMVALFRELRRSLKPTGTLWLNLGDSYAHTTRGAGGEGKQQTMQGSVLTDRRAQIPDGLKPKDLCLVPYRVALALQADGWWLRDNIVWHKPNPMPSSVTDRCTSAHEAVFLLTKSARYWFDAEAIAEPATHAGRAKDTPGTRGGQGASAVRGCRDSSGGVGYSGDGTRNKRNVWTIPTRPYSGSHYAVMPPALVEPCIKAGCPHKVCTECGAAWTRVVDVDTSARVDSRRGEYKERHGRADGYTGSPPSAQIGVRRTVGWAAGCECGAGTAPGIVLDPFGGSGTVAEVAESLGRKWLMFDLDERNVELMKKRTAQRSLLGLMGGEG